MKLYYAPGACSLAPHIALREAGLSFDLERVDLRSHRTAGGRDYLAINPKGSVPAIELPGSRNVVLTEAQVILQYVADLVPDRALIPAWGTFARYQAAEWLAFLSTELHAQFGLLWKSGTPRNVESGQRGKIADRLLYLGDVLGARGYLMGEQFSVCDAYLFVMLQWCGRFGIDLALWPNVDDYETKLAERPAIQAAMAAEGLGARRHYRNIA
ncbi:MAG: glutathione transferase GstA [Myxococcales bacterium]|nr:glutathione transferase GstA [Myxococcales bacterium]